MTISAAPSILIVDDIPQNIQVVANILKNNHYHIAYATDGKTAIANALDTPFDLILLDIMMPGMDGFTVCETLKQDPRTSEIPIIFLTAKTDNESLMRGFECGGVDYVTKPFNHAELMARVATHLKLHQTERSLLELNASKDKLISIITDKLQSPFAALEDILETLLRQFNDLNPDELIHYLDLARQTATSLDDLLDGLFYWSSLQRDALPYQPQIFTLLAVAQEAYETILPTAMQKHIQIELKIIPDIQVYADYTMVKIILRHLLLNAIIFSHSNALVVIEAKEQYSKIVVSVQDHGVGILPKYQQRLFQLDNDYKSLGTSGEIGSGMGLILCRDLVEKQGGTIKLDSAIETGTTVLFTLPMHS